MRHPSKTDSGMPAALRPTLFLALALAATACAGGNDPLGPGQDPHPQRNVAPNGEVVLAPGEDAVLTGADLRVRFVGVTEDSRCPTGVVCVWEGRGVVALEVTAGTEERSVSLETRSSGDHATEAGGYRIEVAGLSPYPVADMPIAHRDYRLTLRITPVG